jgi:phospholipase/carboxylesterase
MVGGGIGIGIALLWRILKRGQRFPFAPALALSLGICIVGNNGLTIGENKMTTFTAHSLPPASGLKPDSIVVLIHGYGANGKDLLALGDSWSDLLPNTLFIAPDGPDKSEVNPFGNQWFGLSDWDPAQKLTKDHVSRMVREIQELTPSFNRYLDELLQTYGLPPEKLALVGFSQGAMLSLHIGLHRPLCAGVIAYSGAFLEDIKEVKVAHPPVLLIHGADDQLLSPVFSQVAKGRLESLGVSVALTVLPDLGHGIDERGLSMGGAFLKKHLYKIPQSDLWERVKEGIN